MEITIQKMAHGGQGLGRANGLVVFVKGALPEETVRARVFRKKRDYAQARLEEVLNPSTERIQPVCSYFPYCGGCQWQHVKYHAQLDYKRNIVVEAMEHIGGLKDILVQDPVPSEETFGYRNKMEFSFSERRWLTPGEMEQGNITPGLALGLHVPGTFNKIIDIDQCLLQKETGNRILREVKAYVKESGIPVYGLKSHQGFWRFLALRHAEAPDEWMANVVTPEERPEWVGPLADKLCRHVPELKTVVNNINPKKAAIAVGEREIVLRGPGVLYETIGPATFRISSNSFFQTNSRGALKLYQTVERFADLEGRERVVDLYSGTGTIPVFLGPRAREITGIEISESAVSDARENCLLNGIQNVKFVCGDIVQGLRGLEATPQVMVIDPPRTGAHKDVLSRVLDLMPEKIVYVSCNPATLARDLGLLAGKYEVVEIQPVDMFPHTYHIESVAKLQLK